MMRVRQGQNQLQARLSEPEETVQPDPSFCRVKLKKRGRNCIVIEVIERPVGFSRESSAADNTNQPLAQCLFGDSEAQASVVRTVTVLLRPAWRDAYNKHVRFKEMEFCVKETDCFVVSLRALKLVLKDQLLPCDSENEESDVMFFPAFVSAGGRESTRGVALRNGRVIRPQGNARSRECLRYRFP